MLRRRIGIIWNIVLGIWRIRRRRRRWRWRRGGEEMFRRGFECRLRGVWVGVVGGFEVWAGWVRGFEGKEIDG